MPISAIPFVSKLLPTDLNDFGVNQTITVTEPLPTVIVWELILDYRYRLSNSQNLLSQLLMGLPLPTFFWN